eukprot:TRINITY_DN48377_c0_g1_i1.p1 TRINITY_DN48377_c0_g1~~TRINITY_DN48377_c0_g1_i1.p1  ORF type:complete len:973 (+),score=238.52 TRINITY_DN48377_c0_g1_i1:78-2996(+)
MAAAPIIDKAASGMRDILSAFSTSEARFFDEERYSEADIRKSLSDSQTDRKIDAMKRILAAVSIGHDASGLFPDVVKNVSFQSLELKRLIYIYLVQYAENNRDLALLSINSFQKDLCDRSQLVRASALRAMASIKVLEVIQLVMVAVKTASSDMSPYVRKATAQCITKVYSVDPDQFLELRGLLLKLMSDSEVVVVSSAVMAFHQICILQPPRLPVEDTTETPVKVGSGPTSDLAASTSTEGVEKVGGGFLPAEAVVKMQLTLLHPHFWRLRHGILLMDAWAQQSCLDILVRYCRCFFACPDKLQQITPALSSEGQESSPQQASEGASAIAASVSDDFRSVVKVCKLLMTSSSQAVILAAVKGLCYLAPAEDISTATRPLLRALRQSSPEGAMVLLQAAMPLIEARPDLLRPSVREFFVQSFDRTRMKELKLKVMEKLVDETNVQLILKELQTYVTWQSHLSFLALSVQAIAHVALKVPSVADACLRGLVKMLDSKCEALSCEAVVSLRALLQQRQKSSDSGLGSVLPHLVRYLDDLAAPSARASVVWIIGQYQREIPRLAPDVLRKLAKSFASERPEVKQQIIGLSLKVWTFHALNARGEATLSDAQSDDKSGEEKQMPVLTADESKTLLPRLEALVDYIGTIASYDVVWDVRDTARALTKLKLSAKKALDSDSAAALNDAASSLACLSLAYCRDAATCGGSQLTDLAGTGEAVVPGIAVGVVADGEQLNSTWMIGSLAQAIDFPLETYRGVPAWATENSSDDLRKQKVEMPTAQTVPKSICSDNIGNSQHMEQRVQNPSNITVLPGVSKLEDLDLFYSDDAPPASKQQRRSSVPAPATGPATTLESIGLPGVTAPGPAASVSVPAGRQMGTAVFGEDDESDEDEESDDGGDDWKYCVQASALPTSQDTPKEFNPPPREAAPSTTEVPAASVADVSAEVKVDAGAAEASDASPVEGGAAAPSEVEATKASA